MKTLIKTIGIFAILVGVSSGISLAGTDGAEAAGIMESNTMKAAFIETLNKDRMVVCLKNPAKLPFSVSILNDKGKAIYREWVQDSETFMKRYDFSELVEGNYTVSLESEDQGYSQSFLLR